MNFVKFLNILFLTEHLQWLLLNKAAINILKDSTRTNRFVERKVKGPAI